MEQPTSQPAQEPKKGFIRRNLAVIIGILLAIGAIYATYDVYLRARPIKSLEIAISEPVSIVSVDSKASKDVQVFVSGQKATAAYIVQFDLNNTGNQPIIETDFASPVHVVITSGYKIANAVVVSSTPSNLGITVTKLSDTELELSKALMNSGDSATVALTLFSDQVVATAPQIAFNSRIAGVREINIVSRASNLEEENNTKALLKGVSVFVVMLICILIITVSIGKWAFSVGKQSINK